IAHRPTTLRFFPYTTLFRSNRTFVNVERLVRLGFTFMLFYSLITFQNFLIIGVIYVLYLNLIYLYIKKGQRINWERLINNDAERLSKFYRFVSLFAEVPHIKSRIRKHRILTEFIRTRTAFAKQSTFSYLYRLTFLRNGEYFALFIRLTIIAVFAIVFITNVWLKLAIALLFMYMTSFQLQMLFYHYRTNVWLELYPLDSSDKETAFLTLAMQISQVQAVLLSISFLAMGEWLLFFIMLLA